LKKLQRYRLSTIGSFKDDDGCWCAAQDVNEIEAATEELMRLLDLAWEVIQEAGYEDHSSDLRDNIEKYTD